jgi:hypothetical protein
MSLLYGHLLFANQAIVDSAKAMKKVKREGLKRHNDDDDDDVCLPMTITYGSPNYLGELQQCQYGSLVHQRSIWPHKNPGKSP